MISMVRRGFEEGVIEPFLNKTFISLISKVVSLEVDIVSPN